MRVVALRSDDQRICYYLLPSIKFSLHYWHRLNFRAIFTEFRLNFRAMFTEFRHFFSCRKIIFTPYNNIYLVCYETPKFSKYDAEIQPIPILQTAIAWIAGLNRYYLTTNTSCLSIANKLVVALFLRKVYFIAK